MNYLMIIVGIAVFFYGYSQNKKMKKNFRSLYEEALKNESEQNVPEEVIAKKKIVDEKIKVVEVINKEINSIDIEKSNEENVMDIREEKIIEKKIIEKQITEEEKKYNIIEKIKNAKDKKTFYKEIVDMLDQYEDDAFRDEIARETGINKGELLLLKNMYKK